MRIDYEYIEKILEVFLDSEIPTVNWRDFDNLRGGNDHKFVFHIEIMVDKGLIASTLENGSIGIRRTAHDYTISIVNWRLTAEGHDFASAITKPSVLAQIKERFQREGLSVVIELSKKIVEKQAEKVLEL
ncbi:hypothetical protein [Alcanivorax sp. IL2]|uniref:hypothetical protein n=1 Tax=Alcanivorax sp. IL2 TaxID=3396310 RepID=UPI0039C18718